MPIAGWDHPGGDAVRHEVMVCGLAAAMALSILGHSLPVGRPCRARLGGEHDERSRAAKRFTALRRHPRQSSSVSKHGRSRADGGGPQ